MQRPVGAWARQVVDGCGNRFRTQVDARGRRVEGCRRRRMPGAGGGAGATAGSAGCSRPDCGSGGSDSRAAGRDDCRRRFRNRVRITPSSTSPNVPQKICNFSIRDPSRKGGIRGIAGGNFPVAAAEAPFCCTAVKSGSGARRRPLRADASMPGRKSRARAARNRASPETAECRGADRPPPRRRCRPRPPAPSRRDSAP